MGPSPNEEIAFIFRYDCSDRMYGYFRYKNVTQSAFVFAYKI